MFDVVVIGQGLSGLLSAIQAKEQGYHTALVATGTGKIMQSTGVMDLIPGNTNPSKNWIEFFQLYNVPTFQINDAIDQFKALMNRLHLPYNGSIENPKSIVTGAGYVKQTVLFPESISPLPTQGHVAIVGFKEIPDFQANFVAGNLLKSCPQLTIDTYSIQLDKSSQRTLTQLDAAHLLDQKEIRSHCIKQIKKQMAEQRYKQPQLFIFPAALGVDHWQETLQHFSEELGAKVTEAPGMPPNATAIRLFEVLRKEATKLGVRFYLDTSVVGCKVDGDCITSLQLSTNHKRFAKLYGKQFILATGGVLGGGLKVTSSGFKETALQLDVNNYGELLNCPKNLYPIGASKGTKITKFGITGGIYTILSSYETISKLQQSAEGGVWSA